MTTTPRLIERHPGITALVLQNDPGVSVYKIGAANTLDNAFAGTTAMFSVPRGDTYRSYTLQKNRLQIIEESKRNQTHVAYNLNDFASATVPGDSNISFIRVTEYDLAGVAQPEGPILAVPPPNFFATGRRNLILAGSAPNTGAGVNDLAPDGAMIIALPKYADEVVITNTDGADDLMISFGQGLPKYTLGHGETRIFKETGLDFIFLWAVAGVTTTFEAAFSIVNGIQA